MRSPLDDVPLKITSPMTSFRPPVQLPDGTFTKGGPHNGIDLRAPIDADGLGQLLRAPEDGRISNINTTNKGALQLFLETPRRRWAFVHLGQVTSFVGQQVRAGDVIGVTGRSGGVAPHLHLEIRELPSGRLVDPAVVLAEFLRPNGPPSDETGGGGALLGVAALALLWGLS